MKEQVFYLVGKCLVVVFLRQVSRHAVFYDAGDASLVCGDARHTVLHGLQQYQGETLIAVERGKHEDVGYIEERIFLRSILLAVKTNIITNYPPPNLLFRQCMTQTWFRRLPA